MDKDFRTFYLPSSDHFSLHVNANKITNDKMDEVVKDFTNDEHVVCRVVNEPSSSPARLS